jgi:hypothetical protein
MDDAAQSMADSERCWCALRYSKPRIPSYTSAIKILTDDGQMRGVATSAGEKEDVFMKQAFPYQEMTDDKTSNPNTTTRFKAKEVKDMLFAQLVKKALGIDKLGFRTLRLLYL